MMSRPNWKGEPGVQVNAARINLLVSSQFGSAFPRIPHDGGFQAISEALIFFCEGRESLKNKFGHF